MRTKFWYVLLCLSVINITYAQQQPLTQIEGYLEVARVGDSTSMYIGQNTARNIVGIGFRSNLFMGNQVGRGQVGGASVVIGHEAASLNVPFGSTIVGYRSGANANVNTPGRNSFFGFESGQLLRSGFNNSFYGYRSGNQVTLGHNNSYFGISSGESNNGSFNSFFGSWVGKDNSIGSYNSYFGALAGSENSSGSYNSFFGYQSGYNSEASQNSFFGVEAGYSTTTGGDNSFFGAYAGRANIQGRSNAFFGAYAGHSNISGDGNS
ncbi:MAG: hypothetical protein AAFR14_11865, partial [Bacteroidota bacterium]